ncbi:hypothetical protein BJX65DRAFT_215199 [Aspergillus insuetus]
MIHRVRYSRDQLPVFDRAQDDVSCGNLPHRKLSQASGRMRFLHASRRVASGNLVFALCASFLVNSDVLAQWSQFHGTNNLLREATFQTFC